MPRIRARLPDHMSGSLATFPSPSNHSSCHLHILPGITNPPVHIIATRSLSIAPEGTNTIIGFPIEVQGLEGLTTSFEHHGIRAANGLPIIEILGRTLLQFAKFTYNGLSGNIEIEIDESIMKPRIA